MFDSRRHRIAALAILLICSFLPVWIGCNSETTAPGPVGPTVTLTSPSEGETLRGAVPLTASASNAVRVVFSCDGMEAGRDSVPPYAAEWNSGTVSNGSHVITARAEGSGSAESRHTVTVDNLEGVIILTVSPTQADVALGGTVQFTATVTGTAQTGVLWTVAEGAGSGSISGTGLYTAPAVLPSPAMATVTATSVADPTKSASARVDLHATPVVTVEVTPATANIALNATGQFTATVTGNADTGVTWTVVEGAAHGSISATGLYTAPAALPSPPVATVRATSTADPTRSATALVTLSTDQPPPADASVSTLVFDIGHDMGSLSRGVVEAAASAIWAVVHSGGQNPTGTLTQQPNGDWAYAATPADRLIVHFQNGIEVELVFSGTCQVWTGGTVDQAVLNHELTFHVKLGQSIDADIHSVRRNAAPGAAFSPANYSTREDATIRGTILDAEGHTLAVDMSYSGTISQSVECPSVCFTEMHENFVYQGTVESAGASYTINQDYTFTLMSNTAGDGNPGRTTQNMLIRCGNTAVLDGVTYSIAPVQAQIPYVQWETYWVDGQAYEVAHDPNYWQVDGALQKNGVEVGRLGFNRPIGVNGTNYALVLHLGTGESLFLRALVGPGPY